MSRERFDWLEQWVADPDGHHPHARASRATSRRSTTAATSWPPTPRTSSSTSSPSSATTSSTTSATGRALGARVRALPGGAAASCACGRSCPATGSAGTIGAGDYLKERVRRADRRRRGARVPDDARERLRRAQHPGDRRQAHPADPQRDEHRRRARRLRSARPTRWACCSAPRRAARYLARRRGVPLGGPRRASTRSASRASATCSARSRRRSTSASGPTTSIVTVATDGAAMYGSERELALARHFPGRVRRGRRRRGVRRAHARRGHRQPARAAPSADRERIFNLGYFTWVEQQGVSIEEFEARRDPGVLARHPRASSPSGTG